MKINKFINLSLVSLFFSAFSLGLFAQSSTSYPGSRDTSTTNPIQQTQPSSGPTQSDSARKLQQNLHEQNKREQTTQPVKQQQILRTFPGAR